MKKLFFLPILIFLAVVGFAQGAGNIDKYTKGADLFFDNFTDNSNGWRLDYSNLRASIQNGRLEAKAKSFVSDNECLYRIIRLEKEKELEVAFKSEMELNGTYGIMFYFGENKTVSHKLIFTDNYVYLRAANSPYTSLSNYSPTPDALKHPVDLSLMNTYVIRKTRDRLYCYINSVLYFETKIESDQVGIKEFGIYVGGKNTLRVEEYRISEIISPKKEVSAKSTPSKVFKVAMLAPVAVDGKVTIMQKQIIRGAMEEAITAIDGYQAFTREDIDQIMQEHAFQQSGMVADEQRKQLGRMTGADLICVIKITVEEDDFFVNCSLTDIESGEIIRTGTQLMPIKPRDLLYNGCTNLANYLITGEKKAAAVTSVKTLPATSQTAPQNTQSSSHGYSQSHPAQTASSSGAGRTSRPAAGDLLTAATLCKEGVKLYNQFRYLDAFTCFQKAVNFGSIEAMFHLSNMYANGNGVDRDLETAYRLMFQSATAGYTPAYYSLAQMYDAGDGVAKDKSHARNWYSKAAATGNQAAKHRLNTL